MQNSSVYISKCCNNEQLNLLFLYRFLLQIISVTVISFNIKSIYHFANTNYAVRAVTSIITRCTKYSLSGLMIGVRINDSDIQDITIFLEEEHIECISVEHEAMG